MTDHCCDSKKALAEEIAQLAEQLKTQKQKYQQLLIENLQKDLIIRQLKLKDKRNKFLSFKSELSETCIDNLNSLSDSKFVAIVLSELYNGDTETIKKISLTERKNGEKIEIRKKQIIENIFAERLKYISPVDESRKQNLNKLMRNAIDNAKRK